MNKPLKAEQTLILVTGASRGLGHVINIASDLSHRTLGNMAVHTAGLLTL